MRGVAGRRPKDEFDPCKGTYLDGSGGIYSSDPRVRAVGWAWIQLLEVPQHEVRPVREEDAIGQYGSCEGPQTVPRAELTAFMKFLMFLYPRTDLLDITIIQNVCTDNEAVYDGFCAGYKVRHGSMGDLWAQFWMIYQTLQYMGWIIILHKVKSHTTIEDMVNGKYPFTIGKEMAWLTHGQAMELLYGVCLTPRNRSYLGLMVGPGSFRVGL